ncbi:unnamed protein product [Pleuronectes platessa]|uniref:Uncharacterized protein n=1 Tax=Pleuronectes platessa TaxID=8262 RepID=A0A9N7UA62_PLEPL|nr:unnamed protein product [Pleuronectes platessa]
MFFQSSKIRKVTTDFPDGKHMSGGPSRQGASYTDQASLTVTPAPPPSYIHTSSQVRRPGFLCEAWAGRQAGKQAKRKRQCPGDRAKPVRLPLACSKQLMKTMALRRTSALSSLERGGNSSILSATDTSADSSLLHQLFFISHTSSSGQISTPVTALAAFKPAPVSASVPDCSCVMPDFQRSFPGLITCCRPACLVSALDITSAFCLRPRVSPIPSGLRSCSALWLHSSPLDLSAS